MRLAFLASAVLAFGLAACGPKTPAPTAAAPADATGDPGLIAAAQTLSDSIGGCPHPTDAARESRVVTLEATKVVMLACGQDEFAFSDRLFTTRQDGSLRMLSLPDYEGEGWYSTDQASMAELDAGAGVLTTRRKAKAEDTCGSEGRYQWNGERFNLQEMRWQSCDEPAAKGAPFQIIWPAMPANNVDPSASTPAP